MVISTPKEHSLAPAVSNKWQLCAFLLFVGFILFFPFLPKGGLIDRGKLYLNIPKPHIHTFEYFSKTIWQYPGDIDILFIGNSGVGADIIPNILMDQLPPLIGKKPVIFIATHNGDRIEIEYMQIKDLLAHRKVKLIIWQLNAFPPRFPEKWTEGLWDFSLHWDIIKILSNKEKMDLYWQSVSSSLRTIYTSLRSSDSVISKECFLAKKTKGEKEKCNITKNYFGASLQEYDAPLVPMQTPLLSALDEVHWRSQDSLEMQYSPKLPDIQQKIIDTTIDTASKHGTAIAFIQVPYELRNRPANKLIFPFMEKNTPSFYLPLIGIVKEKLFPGLNDDAIADYYANGVRRNMWYTERGEAVYAPAGINYVGKLDMWHMNRSGAIYFTHAVTPAIAYLYNRLVLHKMPNAGFLSQ